MFEWLGNTITYEWLGLSIISPVAQALQFFIMDTAKIFVLLISIIYIMGLLRSVMRPERVRDYVRGKPQWQARSLAILLGAITPFCSCSSVPLFIGFVEAGIPLGITFSFLIASPMINEVAVVLLVGILGFEVAALYVAAGLLVAFVGGMIMQWFKPERWVEDYVWKIQVGAAHQLHLDTSLNGRHRFAMGEVREIVGRIWKWVVVGIAAGALFHGYVPGAWIQAHLATADVWSVPAAVLIGIPLYSNATGVIPLAEAMLGKGVAIGTVLALMMSIAALSLPEMLILKKVIRWPALAIYAAVLALSFTLVGWVFNGLFA